jgi:hypothetical protein
VPPKIQNNREAGIENGRLVITMADLREVYGPVKDEIVRLVDEQVQRVKNIPTKVTAILLVGGFGGSEYLFKEIRRTFSGGRDYENIPVINPVNA